MAKHVVLNIGHGGDSGNYDSGAIAADGTHEHAFNRDELGPLVKSELESLGFKVTTVIQNRSFGELPSRINALNPDVILSLHFNAYNGQATGTETLYWNTSKRGKALASEVQARMVDVLGLANRGIKPKFKGDRGAALLRDTKAPCLILEPFFGDNPDDLKQTRNHLPELAKAIAGAVLDVL